MATRKPEWQRLNRKNMREQIEGCFVFTRDQWIVIASALDRFVTGRDVPIKARAKSLARQLGTMIRKYVLADAFENAKRPS